MQGSRPQAERHLPERASAQSLEPAGDARADAPDVRDGSMRPDEALEALLVELTDVIGHVLGRDVEGDLGQKEVGPHARRGTDAGLAPHELDEVGRQLAGRLAIAREVGGHVDEALVDGVDMDVLGREEPQVESVDLRGDLHVAPHARRGHLVVYAVGNLEDAAAVAHPERLHGRGDGEADGGGPARGVSHYEPALEGVVPSVDALDRGVEALEVDAEVGTLHDGLQTCVLIVTP